MTTNNELLSCPFCGGSAEAALATSSLWDVYCTECPAGIDPKFKSKAEAIAAWNRRMK